MKKVILAALFCILPITAHAGPYLGAGAVFNSVSFGAPLNGVVPGDLSGYRAEAGWTYRRVGIGVEYASASSSKSGNDLSANRFGANADFHLPVIPGIDTYLQGGIGRSSYHADISTYAAGVTTRSRLFSGDEIDWNIGAGAIVPVYGPLKARLFGRYQPTGFGDRAQGGIVFGLGLVLAR